MKRRPRNSFQLPKCLFSLALLLLKRGKRTANILPDTTRYFSGGDNLKKARHIPPYVVIEQGRGHYLRSLTRVTRARRRHTSWYKFSGKFGAYPYLSVAPEFAVDCTSTTSIRASSIICTNFSRNSPRF